MDEYKRRGNLEKQEQNGKIEEIEQGFRTACIDGEFSSNLAYRPQFVSNNYEEGKKVLASLEEELLSCDSFAISVAFITMGGITPFLQILKELEHKGIKGKILTTDYQMFSDPKALKRLGELKNIELRMYCCKENTGFHTKGYIFKREEVYRIITGSSNMTLSALTQNKEWNTKIISTEQGEYASQLLDEFDELWEAENTESYEKFIAEYQIRYEIIRKQRDIARKEKITSIAQYRLEPNTMQVQFISNLKKILEKGEDRALLISATGTGKTYASAFAMRELGFKRVLFLVHRGQLARQTKKSYEKVFGSQISFGLVGGGYHEYEKDYIFATVQTLNRDTHLFQYQPDEFDCIILDEAHHSTAETYQKVMNYFKPKLFLGMTATPDKMDDNEAGKNVYELFNFQIAHEIRLQQAMQDDLLCPFEYFGICDIYSLDDKKLKSTKLEQKDFNRLTGEERVKHIIQQAEYYGYSGNRVKGLVFCSRIDESEELSKKFNQYGYRTIALNGNASEEEREEAFERLAMEEDSESNLEPLDYIFSVEILNEGVDIVEVNQVIMLRPTQSPIVFIQQLGRGLRKAEGKQYVVILDFIGNYNNNFMIPVALSGDRSYNADTIRKYVISGNSTIPGESTIHFDEVSKNQIFQSIDKMKGIKTIIRNSYISLKNRLGRVPFLIDFYENGEIDPLVIIKEYKTYNNFLEKMEKSSYENSFSEQEKLTLEYLSKTVLSGVRPDELEILKYLMTNDTIEMKEFERKYKEKYGYSIDETQMEEAVRVLQGNFVINQQEYQKFCNIDILRHDEKGAIKRLKSYENRLEHKEFYKQIEDIISVGIARYSDKYEKGKEKETPFVLYEKYSRRDVSLLMNCGKDLSSIMYGMKRIGDDVFLFVTYHKEESKDEKNYVDGKPDYADVFEDNIIFKWDSKIGMKKDSTYMNDVMTAPKKHLLVKKSDAESNFYYMGQFDIVEAKNATKEDNKGKIQPITKAVFRMHHPVREDLLRYLQF